MTSSEDLDKLFEAALHQKEAPTRFGTPESQRKYSPIPPQSRVAGVSVQDSRFRESSPQGYQPMPAQQYPQAQYPQHAPQEYQQMPAQAYSQAVAPAQTFQAAPAPTPNYFAPAPQPAAAVPVIVGQAAASLDNTISAELGAILDAKVAREKRSRRRSLFITLFIFLGLTGGTSAWFVSNPERLAALKTTIADIKSAGDIKGMVAKYQKALDKIAVRGKQIDNATVSMGVDPASAAGMADQGFDKEMREMMGENGGPTTASRNAKLQEKFKDVQENGSLIKKKE